MGVNADVTVRAARPEDHDDVIAMTRDTWPNRESGDYLARVFPEWIESNGQPKRTVVAEVEGRAVAIAQSVLLSEHEAWGQGLRVHPDHRRSGLSRAITADLFGWAREQGATVMRAMVFAWNVAGLGQARSSGYRPATSIRFVRPTPTTETPAQDAIGSADRPWLPDPIDVELSDDPTAAWRAFQGAHAANVLGGLTLSLDESWALCELTPSILERAADETAVIAVRAPAGTHAMSYRSRTFEREDEAGDRYTVAEYGVATWDDLAIGAALFDAIAADAHAIGADRTRVVVPETPRHVSDAALFRADVHDHPDFVLAADLTGTTSLSRR